MTDTKNIRVLIAEDDSLVSEMMTGVLNELGFIVVGEAENGFVAIEMTKELKPDVILMDIHMPHMHGLEATQRINESCPTPIVILTAFESVDLVKKACKYGVGAYLLKPPEPKELERAILIAIARFEDLMEMRRLNDELTKALEDVKTLSGLIPICSSCKKIRDDEGYWHKLEAYISQHSDAMFTHGLCPDCLPKFSGITLDEQKTDSKE